MNNYYNYMNYNWYSPMSRSNTNYDDKKLFNPQEGFINGNMFENLYSQYKNYKPRKINLENEQERLLYQLQSICFAAHDLNLYLDIHPEDKSMLMLFNDYCKQIKDFTKNYEDKYGPLTVGAKDYNSFEWVSNPWPWEVPNV